MPWKIVDGVLALDEQQNPVWIFESGEEKGIDHAQSIRNQREANAESKSRKEELRALKEKFAALDGIEDLAAFRAEADKAISQVKTLSEKDKELDSLIAARVEAATSGYKDQLAKQDRKNQELSDELNRMKVSVAVKASKVLGERLGPEDRIFMERELLRAGFIGEDGKVQFRDDAGEIFRNEKYEPCNADEAVAAIMKKLGIDPDKKFLSLDNANGSGGTGSNSSMPGVKNPWKKETYNVTEQCRITRDNPALARNMMAAAGAQ